MGHFVFVTALPLILSILPCVIVVCCVRECSSFSPPLAIVDLVCSSGSPVGVSAANLRTEVRGYGDSPRDRDSASNFAL